eukprot:286609_1
MSTVIGLVIILMQINTLTCYLDQYIIYEQRFISQPHYINDAAAWNDNITGVYQINNKLMNAKRLDELRTRWSQFDGEDFNFNEVACYNNSKGSQLFVTKERITKERIRTYLFYLTIQYNNEIWWRRGSSLIEDLFIFDSETEHFEITGNILKIAEAIKNIEQSVIDAEHERKSLYPYFPDEYKVEFYLTNYKVAKPQGETIEGIYEIDPEFKLSKGKREELREMWKYTTLGKVVTYVHCNDSNSWIHITFTGGKKNYQWLLCTKRFYRSDDTHSSSLWVYNSEGYQIAFYDNVVPLWDVKPSDNFIPNWTIYLMMVMSVCCILTVLGIIIKKCCVKDLNNEYTSSRGNMKIHPAFISNEMLAEQQVGQIRMRQHTIAGSLN